ncbi:MAG: AlpA family phage regulatory protein [Betaproteobacteria bacterium]|nr:AlpA family phage regulatory protein [Betaproteobacteria bacterium]
MITFEEIAGHTGVTKVKDEPKGGVATVPTWERLLPIEEVTEMVKISRSKIYQMKQDGKFPAPLKVGRASRWRLSNILAWVSSQQSA